MKVTVEKWDIFEELTTEEEIQAFVDASIYEARNDADPRLLTHALGVAAKAREALKTSLRAEADYSDLYRSFMQDSDPPISAFDKVARSLGYHLTLAPLESSQAPV